MPLDAVCLQALCSELRCLVGARVSRLYMPTRDELHIALRTPQGNRRLLLCAGQSPRVHLTDYPKENPDTPPMFCMLLRKHLGNGLLTAIEQPALERVLRLTFETTDEMGERSPKTLVAELMGRHSNLILLDREGRILDCLRRVDFEMSEKRQVLPGLFYHLPPTQDKLCPLESAPAQWKGAFASAPKDMALSSWFLNSFNGISPLIARELSFRCAQDLPPVSDVSDAWDPPIGTVDAARVEATLTDWRHLVQNGGFTPVLLRQGEKLRDFTYLEPRHHRELETFESFSALLDAFYVTRDRTALLSTKRQDMLRTLTTLRDRTRKRLAAQREELKDTEKRSDYQLWGDLLMAYPKSVTGGAHTVTLINYLDEQPLDIPVDPALSAPQNAVRYYKAYRKAKTAQEILSGRIAAGEKELYYFESVLDALQRATSPEELVDIRQELVSEGILKNPGKQKRAPMAASRPHAFLSSTGVLILVGRNNRQNDQLTLKSADRRDIWLHTQKIPGSHVIISLQGKPLDDQTLLEAATLAANHSQAASAPKVPVDYTFVARVKKPTGSPPGFVIYEGQKTLYITPDATLPGRLRPAEA